MRIVTLLENTKSRDDLSCEHGLSLYIETGKHKILFDAGQTGIFADNAEKLGIDLAAVDFAVLSHGHYDHGGGLCRFLEINKRAPVYLHRDAFEPHFNGDSKYIGLDPQLQSSGRLIFVEADTKIAEGIALHTCRPGPYPVKPFGLTVRRGNQYIAEDFRHEQYLLVEEQRKRICFSGCSHRGILNIMHQFRPDILVGGFHFMKLEDEAALKEAAEILLGFPCTYYTGHCTGQPQFAFLKAVMGDALQALSTGREVSL